MSVCSSRSVGTVPAKIAALDAALTGRTRGQRRRQAGVLAAAAVTNGIKEEIVIAEAVEIHAGNDRVSAQKSGRQRKPARRGAKGTTLAAAGLEQEAKPTAKHVAKSMAKPAATPKQRRASVTGNSPDIPITSETKIEAMTKAAAKPKGRRAYKSSAMTAAEISAAVDLRAAAVLDASKAAHQPKGKKNAEQQAGVVKGDDSKNLGVVGDEAAGVGELPPADDVPETDMKPAKKRRVADPEKVGNVCALL